MSGDGRGRAPAPGVRRVLPVVHVGQQRTAVDEAVDILAAGADGVVFIEGGTRLLREIVRQTRLRTPRRVWLGVNLLELTMVNAVAEVASWGTGPRDVSRVDGLWADNARVLASRPPEQQPHLAALPEACGDWTGEVLGGVAFKYQQPVPAQLLRDAARVGASWFDVVCTSGPGTGQPAAIGKLKAMRAGVAEAERPFPLRSARLAVASGVDPGNAERQLRYVDDVLVATGIERDHYRHDPVKLKALLAARDAVNDPASLVDVVTGEVRV